MMKHLIPMMIMFAANPLRAQDWQVLTGPLIETALSGRVLAYDGGVTQNFFLDGRTLYTAGAGESWGRWRVVDDAYCSVWPPSETWVCYGVEMAAGGLDLRFVAKDGGMTVGRYQDLQ